nr:DUF3137 domain-containing protein [Parvularcula dongshanensis]
MGGIDPRTLEAAGLLPPHDRAEYTHHVKGPYRGVGAEFCAAHLTRRETRTTTDSRGRLRTETRTVTVFRGVYARFSLPRPLPARVYLRRDGGFLEGVFGGGPKGCERVRVEDPEFERRFTLFSDDQVGARVLFTTTFMARVLRAAEIAQNGRLAATFEGDEILVRIPRPDLSLGLGEIRGPGDAERETTRLAAAFARLLSVADTLGLTDQPASPS